MANYREISNFFLLVARAIAEIIDRFCLNKLMRKWNRPIFELRVKLCNFVLIVKLSNFLMKRVKKRFCGEDLKFIEAEVEDKKFETKF